MYSIAGKIDGDKIQWAEGEKFPQFIASGRYPKVAINDSKVVVEVHKSQWWKTLWYRVGTLDEHKKEVNWSENDRNAGCNPAVALFNDGTVIVAYQEGDKTLYCVGKVKKDATEITWKSSGVGELFTFPTKDPSISMNETGLVVVAAEGCGIWRNNIVFRVGTLERSNYNITWNEIDQAASENVQGCGPVVAINSPKRNHNVIISVHMSNSFRKLFIMYGVVNADTKKIKINGMNKASRLNMILVCIQLSH